MNYREILNQDMYLRNSKRRRKSFALFTSLFLFQFWNFWRVSNEYFNQVYIEKKSSIGINSIVSRKTIEVSFSSQSSFSRVFDTQSEKRRINKFIYNMFTKQVTLLKMFGYMCFSFHVSIWISGETFTNVSIKLL